MDLVPAFVDRIHSLSQYAKNLPTVYMVPTMTANKGCNRDILVHVCIMTWHTVNKLKQQTPATGLGPVSTVHCALYR